MSTVNTAMILDLEENIIIYSYQDVSPHTNIRFPVSFKSFDAEDDYQSKWDDIPEAPTNQIKTFVF